MGAARPYALTWPAMLKARPRTGRNLDLERAAQTGAFVIVRDEAVLIVIHNHPSGDPTPSTADIRMTHEIIAIAKPMGIAIHDHLIVGRHGHSSLKALKFI